MKAIVAAFNQEKALVGDFSVIVKTDCGTDGALHSTSKEQDQVLGAGSKHRLAPKCETESCCSQSTFLATTVAPCVINNNAQAGITPYSTPAQ